jgi:GAF domain-containing protein
MRLEAEIARLQGELAGEQFARELRKALTLAAATGAIAAPVSHTRLLEMIVETAAQVIGARAASLFLVDEQAQELVFEVALGQKAAEVKHFRVPLGHGIAGLVAVSGQPIAISDAQSDPRHAVDIARSVGYVPQSILCIPLFYDEQVIGVLELLDKEGAPAFSASDTTALGHFANLAAVAIEQSRTHRNLGALLGEALHSLSGGGAETQRHLRQDAEAFTAALAGDDLAYRRALELAMLVQQIAGQGEHELALCRTVLEGIVAYTRARPDPLAGLGSW